MLTLRQVEIVNEVSGFNNLYWLNEVSNHKEVFLFSDSFKFVEDKDYNFESFLSFDEDFKECYNNLDVQLRDEVLFLDNHHLMVKSVIGLIGVYSVLRDVFINGESTYYDNFEVVEEPVLITEDSSDLLPDFDKCISLYSRNMPLILKNNGVQYIRD